MYEAENSRIHSQIRHDSRICSTSCRYPSHRHCTHHLCIHFEFHPYEQKGPQDLTISNNKILEGTKDLVLGSLSTIDKDQGSGVAFNYKIAEAVGTDYALFEINSNNELVLKTTPDYSEKSSYEVFVVTTDDGGKTFSKKITIDVTPDPHENFLVKFKVKYIQEGDVGAEYNTTLSQSKVAYETFLDRMFESGNSSSRNAKHIHELVPECILLCSLLGLVFPFLCELNCS